MAEQRLMKDGLSLPAIQRISVALSLLSDDFPVADFEKACLKGLQDLELKERVQHIIAALHQYLPSDFEQVARLLLQLKSQWNFGDSDDALRGFAAWPLIDYVAEHGMQHVDLSLQVLEALTALFSSEFAVRFFILQHYDATYAQLLLWAEHDNEHIRRLASEGSRPRLPWGIRLPLFCENPDPLWPILEKLKSDPSDYVRRSVANNLNDISKDNPDWVIRVCKKWKQDATKETIWVIKHATRSLVKNGHHEVFSLLDYTDNPDIKVSDIMLLCDDIKLGEQLDFEFSLQSEAAFVQHVVVDFVVHHQKSNGRTSAKVFKLKTLKLAAGENLTLTKTKIFKAITTRKYYSGLHSIEILINGVPKSKADFMLRVKDSKF